MSRPRCRPHIDGLTISIDGKAFKFVRFDRRKIGRMIRNERRFGPRKEQWLSP